MKHRTLLIILGVSITVLVSSLGIVFAFQNRGSSEDEKPTEIVELDNIPEYGYVLEDRDTELYKSTFDDMREVLTKEEVDYKKYAELLSKLYIVDLYTISNKMNQYDVGGSDFVLESAKESYELKVKDTLYKFVEDNSYGKREQLLPEVSNIEVDEVDSVKVKVDNGTYDGYVVSLNWEYIEDLGYDSSAKVTLIKKDNKVFVTNQSAAA